MKATIDIPDDLYRRVKAKSAMQAQTVREVTVTLYRHWLESPQVLGGQKPGATESAPPAWFGAAKRYADHVDKHDMDAIRASVVRGGKSETDQV